MRLSHSGQDIGTTFPAWTGWPVIAGAWLWTLSVIFFVIPYVAPAATYDLSANLNSDLDSTACTPDICSPQHGRAPAVLTVVVLGIAILLSAARARRHRAGSTMDSGA